MCFMFFLKKGVRFAKKFQRENLSRKFRGVFRNLYPAVYNMYTLSLFIFSNGYPLSICNYHCVSLW